MRYNKPQVFRKISKQHPYQPPNQRYLTLNVFSDSYHIKPLNIMLCFNEAPQDNLAKMIESRKIYDSHEEELVQKQLELSPKTLPQRINPFSQIGRIITGRFRWKNSISTILTSTPSSQITASEVISNTQVNSETHTSNGL